jgi:very-short-patch-repair endonuclease
MLLLDRRRRVVLEIDGVQHYADGEGRASPARYAEMVSADRELRFTGYEVYRFGGHELADRSRAADVLDKFFDNLLASPDPAWDSSTETAKNCLGSPRRSIGHS